MENIKDYIKWIAKQNVINLTDRDFNELTDWMIKDEQYQKFQNELIRRMKIMEGRI